MIAVVQRVLSANVKVGGEIVGQIDHGMLALVAAEKGDTGSSVKWMANRLTGLRIFEDAEGKMNLDCAQVGGNALLVSNFTVAGDASGGRRPSFTKAAAYDDGKKLFDLLVDEMRATHPALQTGRYGEEMAVELVNDGPITLIVETPHG
ncbi:MAG: D-aminoacyl-tRNA deacylase [Fimbriimonadales bacterium]